MKYCLLLALLSMRLLLTAPPLPAQASMPALAGDTGLVGIAESADLRRSLWDSHINVSPTQAGLPVESVHRNAWAVWKLARTSQGDKHYVILSPERQGRWPIYAQGSWILRRSAATGAWEQAKIFLRSDPDLYIKLYPFDNRTRMDVLTYGAVLYFQITVPLTFEQALRAPLRDLMAMTADSVDWSLFSPQPSLYADTRHFIQEVRRHLPGLRYADDGALDEHGQAVFIANLLPQPENPGLNCSGFLKWLVDGMLYPLTGEYLAIGPLKEPMIGHRGSGFTESWESVYDPFFGLDWSRALASASWQSLYRHSPASPLEHDVGDPGFSLFSPANPPLYTTSGYIDLPAVQPQTGMDIRGLKAYLFILASKDPGRMYFAQFNARDTEAPVLRRYFHVAALLPFFDEQGIFRVVVFESATETSLQRLLANPRYEFVQLVRMPILRTFQPPRLP